MKLGTVFTVPPPILQRGGHTWSREKPRVPISSSSTAAASFAERKLQPPSGMGGHDEDDIDFERNGADAPATMWLVLCEANEEAVMKARATLLTNQPAVAGPRLCWSCTPDFLLALTEPASHLLGRSSLSLSAAAEAARAAALGGASSSREEGCCTKPVEDRGMAKCPRASLMRDRGKRMISLAYQLQPLISVLCCCLCTGS